MAIAVEEVRGVGPAGVAVARAGKGPRAGVEGPVAA